MQALLPSNSFGCPIASLSFPVADLIYFFPHFLTDFSNNSHSASTSHIQVSALTYLLFPSWLLHPLPSSPYSTNQHHCHPNATSLKASAPHWLAFSQCLTIADPPPCWCPFFHVPAEQVPLTCFFYLSFVLSRTAFHYLIFSFLSCTRLRTASPFNYITYLWMILVFSRGFHKVL